MGGPETGFRLRRVGGDLAAGSDGPAAGQGILVARCPNRPGCSRMATCFSLPIWSALRTKSEARWIPIKIIREQTGRKAPGVVGAMKDRAPRAAPANRRSFEVPDDPGVVRRLGMPWVGGAGHREPGVDRGHGWRGGPLRCLPWQSRHAAGWPKGVLRVAACVDMPGRECNTTRDSIRSLLAGLAVPPRSGRVV